MNNSPLAARNRRIYYAHRAGIPTMELATRYGISRSRVLSLVMQERLRISRRNRSHMREATRYLGALVREIDSGR
jgi:DNA-binding CsgD family transcriptional regulator